MARRRLVIQEAAQELGTTVDALRVVSEFPSMQDMAERFSGRRLRAERIRARISIDTLSARSGVDRRIISELESGIRRPDPATQMDLAYALRVRLQAFYSEDLSE